MFPRSRSVSIVGPKSKQGAMAEYALVIVTSCWIGACARTSESFDLVLKSGRVADPETGLDAVRDVGIRGDTIQRI